MHNRYPIENNHQKVPNLFSEKPTLDHISWITQMRSLVNVKISLNRRTQFKTRNRALGERVPPPPCVSVTKCKLEMGDLLGGHIPPPPWVQVMTGYECTVFIHLSHTVTVSSDKVKKVCWKIMYTFQDICFL